MYSLTNALSFSIRARSFFEMRLTAVLLKLNKLSRDCLLKSAIFASPRLMAAVVIVSGFQLQLQSVRRALLTKSPPQRLPS